MTMKDNRSTFARAGKPYSKTPEFLERLSGPGVRHVVICARFLWV
jgi:hypothetical protein